MQGTHHVVEGGQLFPLSRLAYDNRSVEELRIVGVNGLTGFQHHVVGDVDCQRDGAHPGELHAASEPPWARPIGIDPGDGEGYEDRASVRQQLHRITIGGLDGHRTVHRVGECHLQRLRRLASDTAN